jgi:CubicO group peptidase (beta-lactamase class C family)
MTEKSGDLLFEQFSGNVPGASVLVRKNGKAMFAKACGLASLERKTPCSTNTNFRLASVTKSFTAMSVLILAEQGKISLDDPIAKFFPEFPGYGKEITVWHLLTHTSGLPDYEDFIPPGTMIPLSDCDVLWILRQREKGAFSPGAQFHYSNSGYALLALLVEEASGEIFPAFLRRHIFEPLEMNNTVAHVAGISSVSNRAYGYSSTKNNFQFSDQSITSAVLGDGGIYSSVVDLAKWDAGLDTEKLVSRKMLEQAFSAHSPKSDFGGSGYGFGWYIGNWRGAKRIWHYGSTCGFSTHIDRFPEKKLTVIILTNRGGANVSELAQGMIDLFW